MLLPGRMRINPEASPVDPPSHIVCVTRNLQGSADLTPVIALLHSWACISGPTAFCKHSE